MNLVLFLLAFCAGVAISVQAAINTRLAAAGGDAVIASLISFAVGSLVLLALAVARGGIGQALANLSGQPLWKFSGGFLGAAFVFGTVFLAPRIGMLNLVVLVIAGQLLASMTIDSFGLVEMAVRKVTPVRMAGAAVMLLGVALALFGDRLVSALSR